MDIVPVSWLQAHNQEKTSKLEELRVHFSLPPGMEQFGISFELIDRAIQISATRCS
jgi:hypothetical protein